MIKLVNRQTGGDMWVHESRLDEYLEAGHKFASYTPPENKPPRKKTTTKK